MAYGDRRLLLERIERERESKVILYVTGDRSGLETQISAEVIDMFVDHLDLFGPTKKISLVLYSTGGNTAAAWAIINLLRIFADELEVLVPMKALSAATLMSLGANKIVMTKQATLGPIDPSLNGPLNPQIPGAPPHARAPVSVEAINGYLDIISTDLNVKDDAALAQVFVSLSHQVHPLVLGQIFRLRNQIQQYARKLLDHQVREPEKVDAIISFLCSESGSHDHSINRREARELGLKVEKPSQEFYDILKAIYKDFGDELQLREPYNPNAAIGVEAELVYRYPRCLIESVAGGSHQFVSKGRFRRNVLPPGMPISPGAGLEVEDIREWEGWEKAV